ncbi:MAG: hypothetical protein IPN68_18265 [Bacteroidetes bacterium]|nr:hypothetical protein [Bacteroidota bacterium]
MKRTIKKIVSEDNFLSLAGNMSIAFFGFAGFALLARSFPVDQFGNMCCSSLQGHLLRCSDLGSPTLR